MAAWTTRAGPNYIWTNPTHVELKAGQCYLNLRDRASAAVSMPTAVEGYKYDQPAHVNAFPVHLSFVPSRRLIFFSFLPAAYHFCFFLQTSLTHLPQHILDDIPTCVFPLLCFLLPSLHMPCLFRCNSPLPSRMLRTSMYKQTHIGMHAHSLRDQVPRSS
jgi:hypothetical protein